MDGQGGGIKVLRSFQFCKATIHVVDEIIWPTKDTAEEALPDFNPSSFSDGGLR